MKLLFCQLRNHGDIIRIFPLIDAVKMVHPDWYIGFTCFKEMVDTCKLCKNIDAIIPQPRFSPVTDTQGGTRILDCSKFENCVRKIREEEFDVYVDFHGVFQSAMFGAMCNIKIRLGRSAETSKDGATLFYTNICQIQDKEINRMERHFTILQHLFPEIVPVQRSYEAHDKIVIFPGSSRIGRLKRWNIDRYIEVGNLLGEKQDIVFILGTEEQDLKLYMESRTKHPVRCFSHWEEVLSEIEDAKLILGNDSAHIHLAVWKNVPAIEICGPLSPNVNGVWKYGKGETVYREERCKCPDIWKAICNKEHQCLEDITVKRVMETVKKYL